MTKSPKRSSLKTSVESQMGLQRLALVLSVIVAFLLILGAWMLGTGLIQSKNGNGLGHLPPQSLQNMPTPSLTAQQVHLCNTLQSAESQNAFQALYTLMEPQESKLLQAKITRALEGCSNGGMK